MKMLTMEEFRRAVDVLDIPGTTADTLWTDVLGKEAYTIPTRQKQYEKYLEWYRSNFTKLGKYLNEKVD
jgi:hypothetical protein